MTRRPIIGVIGGNRCSPTVARIAEDVGREISRRGGILICGGLGGVMEAAARGAKESNGTTIGVIPGFGKNDANRYIDIPIVTGFNHARNIIIVRSSDALIAINGGYGTLSEIAFSLILDKPIISLSSWEVDEKIIKAKDPIDAVKKAFSLIKGD